MIKAAVFDFDGTLMDTLVDTALCINHVLKNHGFDEVPIDEYKNIFGGSCYDMINLVTPKTMNDPVLLHEMDAVSYTHLLTRRDRLSAMRPSSNTRHNGKRRRK